MKTITPQQQKVIGLILEGKKIRQASDLAGVSTRQIYRWLDQDAFRQALKDQQQGMIDQVNSRLLALAVKALDTLEETLKDPGAYGQNVARLAADTILTQALKWRDLISIEDRLAALEERLKK